MSDFLHGAYGQIQTAGSRAASASRGAIVYVGTAPVHQLENGANNVNVPILVNNIAEARKYFSYSDDWAKYTLCEAMHVHLEVKGVGPLVFINVLDPSKAAHKSSTGGSVSKTPVNGRVTIPEAESIILDSVTVTAGSGSSAETKEKGVDYDIGYSIEKKTITIVELTPGALGTDALTIAYDNIDATAVTASDVIGTTDNLGTNTGLYAVRNVYQLTGYIPSYLGAPGFSSVVNVHTAMIAVSSKIGGHWDAYVFADLPLMNGATALTLDTASVYKEANGYNAPNETVYFPLALGIDEKKYHISVLAAANFQELLLKQDGIPYKTASNTDCPLISNLYMGEANVGKVYDDTLINEKLNKKGIASAAYVGGRWAIWGCQSAEYNESNGTRLNIAETNRMMLYYISNDFQHRRTRNVDKPTTANDLKTIVSEEQARLDGLRKIGALLYGEVHLNAEAIASSDVFSGDYAFTFNVTTTPLAKSLTAIVNWTDDGFVTYYASLGD